MAQGDPEAKPGTADPPWVRLALIATALAFLALFLFIPVIAVFTEALRDGVGAYLAAIVDPEARSRDSPDADDGRDCGAAQR